MVLSPSQRTLPTHLFEGQTLLYQKPGVVLLFSFKRSTTY